VIRTSVSAGTLDAAAVVGAYKNLANVERDFRSLKAIDFDLRPIYHRLDDRVRAHVLICMLAAYVVWHLRQAWAPLTFTDEDPPTPADPVAPARRSPSAIAKAHTRADVHRRPVRSFSAVLDHLANLTRNSTRIGGVSVDILATPTALQRRAFELIGATIPSRLTTT
jgi:hypothetical protein